jgi:hypothetical protein
MKQNDGFLLILFLLNICLWNQVFAIPRQEKVGTNVSSPDTAAVLFEDLFGRWRDGAAATLGFSPSTTSNELLTAMDSKNTSQSNSALLSGVMGNRRSYQLTAGFTNISSNESQQEYNIAAGYRLGKSLQTLVTTDLTRVQEPVPFNSYHVVGNITYLTKGLLQYQPDRFAFYYHFSELLLDRGALLVSLQPRYGYTMENDVSGSPSSEEWGGPISVSFGLSDNTTLNAGRSYSSNSSKLTSPASLLDANFGSVSTDIDLTSESYSAGLAQRLSGHSMLSVGTEWTTLKTASQYTAIITGSPPLVTNANGRQSYYAISAAFSSLYLDQPVSVGDLRRSTYNGRYLGLREWKNQFRFSYTSPANPLNQTIGVTDDFNYGILDRLELAVGGRYGFARKIAYQSITAINGWNYSIGLTFHNLNFGGNELSDYDFFWGRITDPEDYVAALQWKQEQKTGGLMPKTRVLSLRLQTAIIRNVDVGFNISNTLINLVGTQEINTLSVLLRADVAPSIRIQFLGSRNINATEAQSVPTLYRPDASGGMEQQELSAELRLRLLL